MSFKSIPSLNCRESLLSTSPFVCLYTHFHQDIVCPVNQYRDLRLSDKQAVGGKGCLHEEKEAEVKKDFSHDVFC